MRHPLLVVVVVAGPLVLHRTVDLGMAMDLMEVWRIAVPERSLKGAMVTADLLTTVVETATATEAKATEPNGDDAASTTLTQTRIQRARKRETRSRSPPFPAMRPSANHGWTQRPMHLQLVPRTPKRPSG